MSSGSFPDVALPRGSLFDRRHYRAVHDIARDETRIEFLSWVAEHAPVARSTVQERLSSLVDDSRTADHYLHRYRRLGLLTQQPSSQEVEVRPTDATHALPDHGATDGVRHLIEHERASTDRWDRELR